MLEANLGLPLCPVRLGGTRNAGRNTERAGDQRQRDPEEREREGDGDGQMEA
jgi:hypothetical protein